MKIARGTGRRWAAAAAAAALMLAGCGDGLNEDPPDAPSGAAAVSVALAIDGNALLTAPAGRSPVLMRVANAGSGVATNVVLSYQVTGGTVISAISCTSASGGAACPASPASLTVPSLPPGGAVTYSIELNYAAALAGPLNVVGSFTAENDPITSNNSATLAVPTTFVVMVSDNNDYVGAGQRYLYDRNNATLTVTATGNRLDVTVLGAVRWDGNFQEPGTATQLQTGSFTGLTRYPFQAEGAGGLAYFGDGRGCNTLTGQFTVDDATYTAGALTSVDLRFVQNCEGGSPALRGRVRWIAP